MATTVTLPYPEITKIPDTEPAAVPSLWNDTYEEIDENFAAVKESIETVSAATAEGAEQLINARELITDLTSTEAASFDGTTDVSIGVTGALPVANGGTGAITASSARSNLGVPSDSSVVHITTAETISGAKTFTTTATFSWSTPKILFQDTIYAKGTAPTSSDRNNGVFFVDSEGTDEANRTAAVTTTQGTDGSSYASLTAYAPISGSTTSTSIRVGYNSSGTAYTYAPTPASGDNSTKIATTAFVTTVATDGTVSKIGTATVGGSSKPIYIKSGVPTVCSEAYTEIPNIVESLDDIDDDGYYWVTGATSSSGNTSQTLAENIDSINTLVENLDLLLALAELDYTEISTSEIDALFD